MALSACSITQQATPEPTSTTAVGSPASDLVLLDNGLGPFRFGDSSAAVIEGVTATVGGWNADSSDNDAIVPPSCDPATVRVVSWGSLVLVFTTRDGTEVFTGWSYGFDPLTGDSFDSRALGLTTPEGVGLDTGREFLIEVYGSAVSIIDDKLLDTARFTVAGADRVQLKGKLDGAGAGGTVDFLESTPGLTLQYRFMSVSQLRPVAPWNRSSRGWNTPLSGAPLAPLRLGSSVRPVVG
jgi:hypothetical protein